MFNSGGAVEKYEVHLVSDKPAEQFDGEVSCEVPTCLSENRPPTATISLTVRGCGRFGIYTSQRPLKCSLDGAITDFNYNTDNGLLILTIPVPAQEMYRWNVEVQV